MRKRYYKITVPKLRSLEKKWSSILNQYRGAAPNGLGIAHMLSESNGTPNPTLRDSQQRPIGLMQIPYTKGLKYYYNKKDLQDNYNNIYVWCTLANDHAKWLHEEYSDWSQPNIDFWVAIRAIFILGRTTFKNIYAAAKNDNYELMVGLDTWNTTRQQSFQRFNNLSRHDLRRIFDHLNEVRIAIMYIDGPTWVGKRFSERPSIAPGTEWMRHQSVANAVLRNA